LRVVNRDGDFGGGDQTMLTLQGRPQAIAEKTVPEQRSLRSEGAVDPLRALAQRAHYHDGQAIFMAGDEAVGCF
jgi:hypothetical protein